MTVFDRGGLQWLCPNCALTSDDGYCGSCGRHLTNNDLLRVQQADGRALSPEKHAAAKQGGV